MKVNSVTASLTSVESMCLWTTQPNDLNLDDDFADQDYNTVEKILAHRLNASAPGAVKFKVRWQDYKPCHDTWEPVSSFVPQT